MYAPPISVQVKNIFSHFLKSFITNIIISIVLEPLEAILILFLILVVIVLILAIIIIVIIVIAIIILESSL